MALTPEFLARLAGEPRGLSMAQAMAIDPLGASYTFVDAATNTPTHIASGVLAKVVQGRWPVTDIQITGSLVEALKRGDLGVEVPHALALPQEALKVPGIVAQRGENDHICLDGAHRLWRRWKDGMSTFPAYVVPEVLWREFVIYDMPGDAAFWDNFNRTAQIRDINVVEYLKELIARGIL